MAITIILLVVSIEISAQVWEEVPDTVVGGEYIEPQLPPTGDVRVTSRDLIPYDHVYVNFVASPIVESTAIDEE